MEREVAAGRLTEEDEEAETEEDEEDDAEEDEENFRMKKLMEVEQRTRRIDGGLSWYGQILQRRKHTGRQQKL